VMNVGVFDLTYGRGLAIGLHSVVRLFCLTMRGQSDSCLCSKG